MQVRIVHEGMRFPLWLHGHTVFTFQVASVFPKNVVGKMMPISVFIVLWYTITCLIKAAKIINDTLLFAIYLYVCYLIPLELL